MYCCSLQTLLCLWCFYFAFNHSRHNKRSEMNPTHTHIHIYTHVAEALRPRSRFCCCTGWKSCHLCADINDVTKSHSTVWLRVCEPACVQAKGRVTGEPDPLVTWAKSSSLVDRFPHPPSTRCCSNPRGCWCSSIRGCNVHLIGNMETHLGVSVCSMFCPSFPSHFKLHIYVPHWRPARRLDYSLSLPVAHKWKAQALNKDAYCVYSHTQLNRGGTPGQEPGEEVPVAFRKGLNGLLVDLEDDPLIQDSSSVHFWLRITEFKLNIPGEKRFLEFDYGM